VGKKLRLIAGSSTTDQPSTPPDLGPAGLAMWNRVTSEFDMSDAGGWLLLEQAARAMDRAASCAEHIKRDGEIVRTPAGLKPHPLIREETIARSFAARCITKLGIAYEPIKNGRAGYP
jgi:hypothetical protein